MKKIYLGIVLSLISLSASAHIIENLKCSTASGKVRIVTGPKTANVDLEDERYLANLDIKDLPITKETSDKAEIRVESDSLPIVVDEKYDPSDNSTKRSFVQAMKFIDLKTSNRIPAEDLVFCELYVADPGQNP